MRNFWNSIRELFVLIRRMGEEELRGIRNTLLYLLLTFYLLCFLQYIFEGNWIVYTFMGLFWFGAILLLFKLRALLRIFGLGEVAEVAGLTANVPGPDNQLFKMAWIITEKAFFLYSTVCLLIPLFPIANNPMIVFIFSITSAVIFLFIWRRGGNWIRPIAVTVSVIILAVHGFLSFPQPSYYLGLEKKKVGMVSAKTAKEANELDKLRAKQRDDIVRQIYKVAREWQLANPGRDLPVYITDNIEAAKAGLSYDEYMKKKAGHGNLIAVVTGRNDGFANMLVESEYLHAGQYCQEPVGKTSFLILKDGLRELGDGKNFTVPEGKEVVAVKTEHSQVKIYEGHCG